MHYQASGDEGRTPNLKDNPRVKNLIYIGSALPTTLVADFGKLAGKDAQFQITGYYLVSAFGTGFGVIIIFAIAFAVSAHMLKRRDATYRLISPLDLAMVYLHSGFAAYRQARADEIIKAQAKIVPAHEALWNFNSLLVAEKRYLNERSEATRGFVINQVLTAMSTAAEAYLSHVPSVSFVANYMIAVPRDQATPEQLELIKFNSAPHEDLRYILVLMRYQDGVTAPRISLPIRSARDYVLPGAPETFETLKPHTVTSRDYAFPRGSRIPRGIQDEIKAYFRVADFESFISLPLIRDDTRCVGIVNIDSRGGDAFAEPPPAGRRARVDDPVARLVKALQPHCTLLAYMLDSGAPR
jgi:hypothetical protein